jgi:hypothetical protein
MPKYSQEFSSIIDGILGRYIEVAKSKFTEWTENTEVVKETKNNHKEKKSSFKKINKRQKSFLQSLIGILGRYVEVAKSKFTECTENTEVVKSQEKKLKIIFRRKKA